MKSKPEFLNDVERFAVEILDSWKDKQKIIFCEEARKFTFNVIVKQVLGLTPEEPQTKRILQDLLTFMRGLISLPLYIPGTPYARAVQARSRISSTINAIIEARKTYIAKGCEKSRGDFLDTLLCVDTLSEDEKVSFILDSLLGGYETTSVLMAMAVHFLGQSPPALKLLKEEHQQIRSTKQKEQLNWEDYNKMEFTQYVIDEVLRFGNVVKFVHRRALKDVKFRDYIIPSGWKVLPVFTAVHLDPSLHESPQEFYPLRWEVSVLLEVDPDAVLVLNLRSLRLPSSSTTLFNTCRWRSEDDEQPMAHPYVEFRRGLVLNLGPSSEAVL